MTASRFIAGPMLLAACGGSVESGPLLQRIGATFEDCNAAEVRFLAAKHDLRLAFEPCHRNEVQAFAWSPDGRRLEFGLPGSNHVLQAERETKNIVAVPAAPALQGAVWVTPGRVVLGRDGVELVIYDPPPIEQPDAAGAVRTLPVPAMHTVRTLLPTGRPDAVIVVGTDDHDAAGAWEISLSDGQATPTFADLPASADLTWSPTTRDRVVARDGRVELVDAQGRVRSSYEDADRGALSPDGAWLLLERKTAAPSPFLQRTWEERRAAGAARAEARAKAYAANAPDWADGGPPAPELSVVDLKSGQRWRITAFAGDHAAWYEAAPGWITFALWGIEGKQLRRNVALVDLLRVVRAAGAEGVEPWTPDPPR
jgi:hypothetical protein